ncbi:unnamed protein product [Caenorhabditis angaria]|uniref:Uncharacterized protein n=1 Tax=Caenorhabditis angaria TaxID=860376 RepID=A0A9P1N0H8_9PELO|nr:unnamed protein product [Caenorhabditis angaria]
MRVFLQTRQGREVLKKQQNAHKMEYEKDSFYFDHFCSVTQDFLIVKQFFIPSKLPYDFEWNKIKSIIYVPQSADRELSKQKGQDSEGRWWALDSLRTSRKVIKIYNIRIDTECEPSKIGFSVVDLRKFLEAALPYLSYGCIVTGCLLEEKEEEKEKEEEVKNPEQL